MKKSYAELGAAVRAAEEQVRLNSLWRHKSGQIYQVLGFELDSDDGTARVVYASNDSYGRFGPKFSRRLEEWTVDRFKRLE